MNKRVFFVRATDSELNSLSQFVELSDYELDIIYDALEECKFSLSDDTASIIQDKISFICKDPE